MKTKNRPTARFAAEREGIGRRGKPKGKVADGSRVMGSKTA